MPHNVAGMMRDVNESVPAVFSARAGDTVWAVFCHCRRSVCGREGAAGEPERRVTTQGCTRSIAGDYELHEAGMGGCVIRRRCRDCVRAGAKKSGAGACRKCRRTTLLHPVSECDILRLSGRGVAQPGSAPAWGAGGRQFESGRPDHLANQRSATCAKEGTMHHRPLFAMPCGAAPTSPCAPRQSPPRCRSQKTLRPTPDTLRRKRCPPAAQCAPKAPGAAAPHP